MRQLTIETKAGAAAVAPEKDYGTKHARPRWASKAVSTKERTFEGLLSTWELDLGGDVIHRGAFRRTLDDWRKSGRIIPLIDNHRYTSVLDVVGKMLEAKETPDGLWTKWQVIDDERGNQVLARVEGDFVDGLSIGYRAVKVEFPDETETRDDGVFRHIHELELREGSVVIWPMNEGARTDADTVKSLLAGLSPEQEQEIRALPTEVKVRLRALLSESEPPVTGTPAGGGLAPDDPKRLELEAAARAVVIRTLEGASAA